MTRCDRSLPLRQPLWCKFAAACVMLMPVASVGSAAIDPKLLERAESLLAAAQPVAAFELLKAQESEFAGSPRFDYLLGLAAIDAGRPGDAIDAFNRVLTVEPRFAGARLELAKALHARGEVAAAKVLFKQLLKDGPSPATQSLIERYLAEGERISPARPALAEFALFVDAGAGFDSNANLSTTDSPFFGLTLHSQFMATESPLAELGIGVHWTRSVRPDESFNAYGRLAYRSNTEAAFLDQGIGSLGANYHFKLGEWRASIGGAAYNGWLNRRQHQRASNLEFGIARVMGRQWELEGLMRVGQLVFEERALQPLDVDRYLVGISMTRLQLGQRGGRLGVAVLRGRDATRRLDSPFGNEKIGLRLFAAASLRTHISAYGEALYLDTDYSRGGFLGQRRHDEQMMVFAGIDFLHWPRKNWTLSPQIRFADNRSSVGLFEYERVEAMVFVRRMWD